MCNLTGRQAAAALAGAIAAVMILAALPEPLPPQFEAEAFIVDMEAFGDEFYLGPRHSRPRRWWQWSDPGDRHSPAYHKRLWQWTRLYEAAQPRSRAAMVAYLERRERD